MIVYGLDIADLPDDYAPLGVVVLVKALDEDGDVVWCHRASSDVNATEVIGAITVYQDTLRDVMQRCHRAEENDDDAP